MMRKSIVSALLAVSMLSGCNATNMGMKQTLGTAAGAVGGGLLGSQVGSGSGQMWAVGVGTLLGALVGSEIGSSLDKADEMAAQGAMQQAYSAPIGQPITWSNPNTGNSGSYVPTREGYQQATGSYCREFQQTISVGGESQRGYGTACRQPDGSWKIVN